VAVVQISKIQVRRGQKNSNTGIPQLSSAELAWAVDTQELYIGNGSVAEGAPEVGNTKIITEKDNIIELASSYRYGSAEPSITESLPRSLGDKIDEIEVSVLDFGANGDGSTDNVAAFELAFTELFRNSDDKFKKVLKIPNGEYLFTSDIEIPSNTILRGETRDQVVLNIGANNILFITSTGLGVNDFNSSNRPVNIELSNFSVSRTTGQISLSGIANSKLSDLKIVGEYSLGDVVDNTVTEPASLTWQNNLLGTSVTNLDIKNCVFENNSLAIKCLQNASFDTVVNIADCYFKESDTAIYVAGTLGQGTLWQINDSVFEEIAQQVFRSTAGQGTKIQRCNLVNCGNNTNSAANPVASTVIFGEYENNIVVNCGSDRQQQAGITTDETKAFYSAAVNVDKASFIDRNQAVLPLSDSFTPFAIFGAENSYITLNYTLRLSNEKRHGKISLTINDSKTTVSLADSYSYSSLFASTPSGLVSTGVEFSAVLADNDDDSGIETVVLSYKNPVASGFPGEMSFDIEYGA